MRAAPGKRFISLQPILRQKKPKNQSHQRENAPKIVVISFGLAKRRSGVEWKGEERSKQRQKDWNFVSCVCVCWCCLWRKVHDHEANYLAKLGESLALSGDEVALFKLCNSATILVVDVLLSVGRARLFGRVGSGLVCLSA